MASQYSSKKEHLYFQNYLNYYPCEIKKGYSFKVKVQANWH